MRISIPGFILPLLLFTTSGLAAADWPMYRADAARSAYTADPLSARLQLSWIRKTDQPPQPAWSGRDTRMPFDLTFQPVVAQGLVCFGSSADCTVYALDAQTGSVAWTFVTDGPVRFAPAIWQDRLFAVSDDGTLYCLALGTGRLLWKRRAGPNQDMILGNDRLISRWPARGGPVIRGGVVYFGAGIWPSEGIFLGAVDAATGETVWNNPHSGKLILEQPHGGNRAHSGVSIQGYLALAGDALIVPTGRATPAVFDPASGAMRYFHLQAYGFGWGARKGSGPFVSFIDDQLFVCEDDVFQAEDGLFLARGLPVSSCAVCPDMVVFTQGHDIKVIKKSALWLEEEDPNGVQVRKLSLENVTWSISCADPVGSSDLRAEASNEAADWPQATQGLSPPLAVGGQTIVAATLNNKIVTADIASKAIVTSAELDGRALGLAIADQALYVSTDKGTIYSFICATHEPSELADASMSQGGPSGRPPSSHPQTYAQTAQEILSKLDLNKGYCVDLGCGDGTLALALARASQFQIIALDEDAQQVALARHRLRQAGLYGSRVTVLQRDLDDSGLPSRFAALVVSGRAVSEGKDAVPAQEVTRLLNPYSGVAWIGKPGQLQRVTPQATAQLGEWTHQYADPANTLCSQDNLAHGPLKIHWFKDFGVQMPSRHGRGPAPLCKDGIMIIEGVHGLLGVDAHSGQQLWHYSLDGILAPYDQEHLVGTAGTGSNMCLAADSVFVRQGKRCLRLHLKTGKLIQAYALPTQDGTWGYIASAGDTLYGTAADRTHIVRQLFRNVSTMSDLLTQSRSLFALDIDTGQPRWLYEARASLRHNAIAIGKDRIYLIDKTKERVDRAERDEDKENKPAAEPQLPSLLCLDARTGKVLWQQDADIYGTSLAVSTQHEVLLMSYQYAQRSFQLPSEKGDRLTGFRTTDGKRLWDTQEKYISRPIINDRTIYAQPYAFDLITGTRHPDFRIEGRQPGGCGPMSGSSHLLLYRSGTLGYVDLLGKPQTQNYGPVRPGCWINAIVAGGLVLMPDATDRCTCSYLMKASVALAPLDEGPGVHGASR